MANSLTVQLVLDGPRNAVVNVAGIVDSADMAQVQAVPITLFTGNINKKLIGLRAMEVNYSISTGLVVVLAWNANSPQLICAISEADEIEWDDYGGIVPNTTASGYEGSINLTTKGFVPGRPSGFTLRLAMTKIYQQ